MIEIIPAIDIINGECVRLSQGDYSRQTTYAATPSEMARRYADVGVKRLHLVDLDGAKAGSPQNLDTLRKIAAEKLLKIEWGGGIKNREGLEAVLNAGADYAIIGSLAVKQPELLEQWLKEFGGERIILGADVRNGKVSVNGWMEDSALSIEDVIDRFLPFGLKEVICTDISKDGMLQGPSSQLYVDLAGKYPDIIFTVSGGISSMKDIRNLYRLNLPRVIVGKAIYENHISLEEIGDFIRNSKQQTNTSSPSNYGPAKRIIPCLDVKNGRTVKGINFEGLADVGDPVELGARYAAEGADELVYLDISASKEGRNTFTELVRRIAEHINIPFTVGGGISSIDDAARLLDAGADKITINSAAVANPQLITDIASRYGRQFVVVAIDAKKIDGVWRVTTHGGSRLTDRELFSWAKEVEDRGAGEIMFTSMDHDGTRSGYPCDTFARLCDSLSIPVIASGGAGSAKDIADVLSEGRADAALAASIFHYGEITIRDLKESLKDQGIPVRL